MADLMQHPAAQAPEPPQFANLRKRLAQAGYGPEQIEQVVSDTKRRAGVPNNLGAVAPVPNMPDPQGQMHSPPPAGPPAPPPRVPNNLGAVAPAPNMPDPQAQANAPAMPPQPAPAGPPRVPNPMGPMAGPPTGMGIGPDPQAQMHMPGAMPQPGPAQPMPDVAGANAARNARMAQRVNPPQPAGQPPMGPRVPNPLGALPPQAALPDPQAQMHAAGPMLGGPATPGPHPQPNMPPRVPNDLGAIPPQEGPRMAGVEDAPIPQPQGSAQRTQNRGGGRGTTGQMPFEVEVTRDPNASRRGGSQGGVKLRAGNAYGPGGSGAAQGRRGPQPTGETLGIGGAGGLSPAVPPQPQTPGPKPQAPGNATPPPASAQGPQWQARYHGPSAPAGGGAPSGGGAPAPYALGGAFDPDGRGAPQMGGGPPAMPQPTIGQPPAQQAPGQPIDASGVDALAQQVQANTPPSDPLGMGLSQDDYRTLLDFGLAMMAAGGQPGATLGGAIGQAGQAALGGKDNRAGARAEAAQTDREMTLEEAKADADVRIAEANRLIEMAKLRQDPIKSVETVEGGRLVGITQRGNRIDLRMKSAKSVNDAIDTARKLATTEVADGMGGTTTQFDPEIYNQTIAGMGFAEGQVGPVRPPLNDDGTLDTQNAKKGMAYDLGQGRYAIYRGGDQWELVQ